MRIKHITPKLTYLVLIAFTAKAWESGEEDHMLGVMEDQAIDRNGWEYEDFNGPAANVVADYAWAFDRVQDRREFVKALKKWLNKQIKLVTIMDVTAD